MYLYKRTNVENWDNMQPEEKHSIDIKVGEKPVSKRRINPDRIKYIIEEVGYWRKANAIHQWFVDNAQDGNDDCRDYHVSRQLLEELLSLVNQVIENRNLASELLPTATGFFFGSTNYDDSYMEDIKSTKDILTMALADKLGDYYYQSSW